MPSALVVEFLSRKMDQVELHEAQLLSLTSFQLSKIIEIVKVVLLWLNEGPWRFLTDGSVPCGFRPGTF